VTIAVAVAVMVSALSIYVAALSRRFSLAPGWQDQRWFSLVALSAGVFTALNVPIMTLESRALVVMCSRFQLFVGTLHAAAWIRYTGEYLHQPADRKGRWLVRGVLALGAAALVPGLVYTDAVRLRTFAPIQVVYRDPVTTWLGDVVLAGVLASMLLVLVRFARAARRGTPHATVHAVALGALLILAANDALDAAGIVSGPYLIDIAYVIPIGVVGYVLTARFAADARALAAIRAHLETLVERRTQELGRTQEALLRSEKLAALGQLAAGVAHEVSSPAAVVAANLEYLEQQLTEGRTPAEGLECIRESSVALRRIGSITRQLLNAGQLAASGTTSDRVAVAEVARDALATARTRCPAHVQLVAAVPAELWASGQEDMLHQVLVNLIVNGAQAVPEGRPGKVEIRGQRRDGHVLITVEDDGQGMPPEILRRVFEPFFTTKPFGSGTGLGLAVSRGLIAGLWGDLRLDSQVGRGTRAVIELAEAGAAPDALPSASGS
jgi:C4-dicarboxylate-specific signal transduction histidine kinase